MKVYPKNRNHDHDDFVIKLPDDGPLCYAAIEEKYRSSEWLPSDAAVSEEEIQDYILRLLESQLMNEEMAGYGAAKLYGMSEDEKARFQERVIELVRCWRFPAAEAIAYVDFIIDGIEE